jgi:valyl-tRNA synthetase
MPFITEELQEQLKGEEALIDSYWPDSFSINSDNSQDVELIKYYVSSVRNFRVEHGIKFSEELELVSFSELPEDWQQNQIKLLSKTRIIEGIEDKNKKYTSFSIGSTKLNLDISASIDIESEKKRVTSRINEYEESLSISKDRLDNKKFVNNAKQDLVDKEKRNFDDLKIKIKELNNLLERLS